ncbi:MAG: hypothetical protein B9S32_00910 [Verrucomicrobia bacterium Tous-C9LFEB]|nr:MAG: hypothetical protein B9S32_00910 [Verrucomicrobia bacterium Tous-C9LFEB]
MAWAGNAPIDPPYLAKPPKVIPIQVGRQLFVDDFLIEKTDLQREYHYPEKYAGNPVLKPDTELEIKGRGARLAAACPKSGGLWWNPDKQLFELWYEAGWLGTIAYATSKDGIHWERPPLQVNPPTNQVLAQNIVPDSWTVVKDYHASDPQQRFKIFVRRPGDPNRALGFVSKDGLDFGKPFDGGMCGDRSTMFYNPFRKVWVFSLRWGDAHGRVRYYAESDDFLEGIRWMPDAVVPWARTDRLDAPNPQIGDNPQLYNLDAVPYESIMLGFFQILHGPANEIGAAKGIPKSTGLNFAYSRDGFYWSRPDRTIAIDSTRQEGWDCGYVQSLGNICVIRGDKIWFYYTGFAGDTNRKTGDPGVKDSMSSGLYANGATGIATLRRDGFVSLNAQNKSGQVTTRMVSFPGKYLFVNADASQGGIIAEVLDAEGRVIEPYSAQNCVELKTDATITQMRWKGADDLARLAGHPVRFRFTLTHAKLYAFWVSSELNGRSDGYVAGGGPGYTSDVDTVGVAALESDKELFALPIKTLTK